MDVEVWGPDRSAEINTESVGRQAMLAFSLTPQCRKFLAIAGFAGSSAISVPCFRSRCGLVNECFVKTPELCLPVRVEYNG